MSLQLLKCKYTIKPNNNILHIISNLAHINDIRLHTGTTNQMKYLTTTEEPFSHIKMGFGLHKFTTLNTEHWRWVLVNCAAYNGGITEGADETTPQKCASNTDKIYLNENGLNTGCTTLIPVWEE